MNITWRARWSTEGTYAAADSLSRLARALASLSLERTSQDDHEGALRAIDEAVAVCRALSSADPLPHIPALASALNSQCTCRAVSGDRLGALQSAEEADRLWQRLNDAEPRESTSVEPQSEATPPVPAENQAPQAAKQPVSERLAPALANAGALS